MGPYVVGIKYPKCCFPRHFCSYQTTNTYILTQQLSSIHKFISSYDFNALLKNILGIHESTIRVDTQV